MSSSKRPARKPPGKAGRGSATRSGTAGAAGRQAAPAGRTSSGPPASARLTIKPGPPSRPRTVDLPPRPQPSGVRRLSEVVLEEDEVLTESFDATLNGVRVRVTAVLERTCVYVGNEGERTLASKHDIMVEADKLPIRRRGIG